MNLRSKTLQALWGAMRVLTDENTAGRFMRECSMTAGTGHTIEELLKDLDARMPEEAFQEKYWRCFQASHRGMLEDASRANARESYRGYWHKRNKELAAKKTVETYDAEFLNIETKGHL